MKQVLDEAIEKISAAVRALEGRSPYQVHNLLTATRHVLEVARDNLDGRAPRGAPPPGVTLVRAPHPGEYTVLVPRDHPTAVPGGEEAWQLQSRAGVLLAAASRPGPLLNYGRQCECSVACFFDLRELESP